MKQQFIAGNWKSNKTVAEAGLWWKEFVTLVKAKALPELATVVVCAPYTALPVLNWSLGQDKVNVQLGAQDVSAYDAGAYTGEITGAMVKEIASWVIIGHSERRKYFAETDELLSQKAAKAKAAGLGVIFCVQDDTVPVPQGVDVVAYEPVWAIGTGKTDTPENANAVVAGIKAKTGIATVIYGGSVTAENVASFTATESIDGVLPGGASLKPDAFFALVQAARG